MTETLPHLQAPWEVGEPSDDETIPEPEPEQDQPRRFTDGAQFILDTPAAVPVVWGTGTEVLWAEGEALMVVGPQGVGKSTVIQQIVRARLGIGDGEVLGHPVAAGARKVLYLACDRPRQISRSMARMFTPADRPRLAERLEVWQGPPPYDFAKNTHCLTAMCETAGADTVVIDSIKDVAIGISDDATGAAYNRARQHALASGVQVIEAHHQTKRGANGAVKAETLADVYGSVWLSAGAGSVIILIGTAGDPIVELRHLKQPADPVGPLKVRHDHDHGTSTIWDTTDLVALARGCVGGLTARRAASSLFGTMKPDPSQVEKARRRLEKLCREAPARLVKATGDQGTGTPDSYYPADQLPLGA